MNRRQTRLTALALVLIGVVSATSLSLLGLKENVTFFYSPADLIGKNAIYDIPKRPFRLGGLVAEGSVEQKEGLLTFSITDGREEIQTVYNRLPPDLFREGQGVVATGILEKNDYGETFIFIASDLLAKHDENYMPPEVARALEKADTQTNPGYGYGKTPEDKINEDRTYKDRTGE